MVRADHGADAANAVARRIVVAGHREGGQAQFVERPLPAEPGGGLAATRAWMEQRLAEPLTVEAMAAHAGYSPRSFARRFVAETGTTPLQWLIGRRVAEAQRLLEAHRPGDRRGRGPLRARLRARAARPLRPHRRHHAAPPTARGLPYHQGQCVSCGPATLGTVDYRAAVDLQERLRARVIAGDLPDLLLLLEHPPVYTLGRRSEPGDLPFGEDHWRAQGIDVVRTQRGGKLTYHGPGQLVGYPIMRTTDVVAFLRTMERAIVAALAEEGVAARGRDHEGPAYTGVWVEDRKIASIGVHLSKGVTAHGFAVNVDNDVTPFHQVTACGLPDVRMTSIALETGRADGLACFRKRMAYAYAQAHGLRQRIVTPARLEAPIPSMA